MNRKQKLETKNIEHSQETHQQKSTKQKITSSTSKSTFK